VVRGLVGQVIRQHQRDGREQDVVDGRARGLLDRLDVVEPAACQGEQALAADAGVEAGVGSGRADLGQLRQDRGGVAHLTGVRPRVERERPRD
jgi:hypothetical protein